MTSPYFVYTIAPRALISPSSITPISQLQLHGCVLIVEENDDAPNPLVLFDEVYIITAVILN